MSERIFIGVAWPYANGPLHLGHVAGAYLPADIFARYHRIKGDEVLMVSLQLPFNSADCLLNLFLPGHQPLDFRLCQRQVIRYLWQCRYFRR